MFTAAFRTRGYDAVLVPLHVAPDDFARTLEGLMCLRNLGGLIFTIPYKVRAVELAASVGPQARVVGAVNALARDGERWKAEIFDGLGCVEAFRRAGQSFAGQRVTLLGAGGAGSAIGVALAYERPAFVRLFDVDDAKSRALADKIRSVSPATTVELAAPRVDDVSILLNASPVGMLDDARLPFPIDRLPRELVVFDAIVKPERTPLLQLAEASGCTTIRGREMMRGQIARMVEFFTADGQTPKIAAGPA
jgi:shikimate dehydrogenase